MNEFRNKIIADSVLATIIVIGVIVSALIVGSSIVSVKGGNNSIIVTGSAKQQITSDLIVWTGIFNAKSVTLADAYKQLETSKVKVNAYLVQQGVSKEKIVFSSINTLVNYVVLSNGQITSQIDYYDLSQTVSISSAEIDKITKISRNATELINDGVQFQSNSPQYLYTKIADLKVAMLAEATKDAKKRAEMIAENAGSRLGGLKYADMGVIQITPLYSNEVSDYGMNDTYSLEKEITAVVHCKFKIRN